MNPIIHIQDDFFENGLKARKAILSTPFIDVTSPIDNITYPHINLNIPKKIVAELTKKIESIMDSKIEIKFLFGRTMIKGRSVPNKVHSDITMGEYSALVYLSLNWPTNDSGTGFYKHDTEGFKADSCTDLSKIDSNSMEHWTKYLHCQAKFNRILIHKADYWHMAEPQDAWGDSPKNGRLVLTVFFNERK